MGQQDPVDIPASQLQLPQPALHPLAADPHIHDQMGAVGPYVNAISAAAACNAAHSHVSLRPLYLLVRSCRHASYICSFSCRLRL